MGTRNDRRHAAEIGRDLGWDVGTLLTGSDSFGSTTIAITALGYQVMLARTICQNGKQAAYGGDRSWRLSDRDWVKAA